ncbi:MAG: DUF2332 domain-containing protein [Rhodospirillaceae bacterium]|jgi:hypothetical protein|nr:DUF2332 domain-containing protein [Rhodospirillaceae bacterium]MBT4044860.1 DUF2332 domain-containing protein [Rhodospirillaceae bacterium]MBT4689993.1 DUF2332 domain-containing protein [Rhodospirillaceae bacterium]MBT5081165.1 DUF2332 domain-containing protein [Rhodospirillaceae bacterium]MBT5523527.1 DUF2332 domain-containing protein [Rhodospirillaceae bacterium]
MQVQDPYGQISARYKKFAEAEARGQSEQYEYLARGISESPELLAFLTTLPEACQQPNLFLAAVRWIEGVPKDVAGLHDIVRANRSTLRDVMLTRTTQTNEPARCSVLVPALAGLKQPLALIEVGASAGLCLFPDHYAYDYGKLKLAPPIGPATIPPLFRCQITGDPPIPSRLPQITWRRGLDLNPISLDNPDQMRWLEGLVWPGQAQRLSRLQAAIRIVRSDPPEVIKGDLQTDLFELITSVPKGLTPVVFHSAVLNYVSAQSDRDDFASMVQGSGAVWISNEAPSIFPQIHRKVSGKTKAGCFLLSIDGNPVAWTGPHGQTLDWFGG